MLNELCYWDALKCWYKTRNGRFSLLLFGFICTFNTPPTSRETCYTASRVVTIVQNSEKYVFMYKTIFFIQFRKEKCPAVLLQRNEKQNEKCFCRSKMCPFTYIVHDAYLVGNYDVFRIFNIDEETADILVRDCEKFGF